jgi:hypothetical protein
MDDRAESETTRRRFLAAAAAGGAVALSGCLATDFSLEAPGLPSEVFDLFSVANSVAIGNNRVRVNATLTDRATTDLKVRELSAIDAGGMSVWSDTVDGGQTSVSMYLPIETPVTVYAFTETSKPVDEQSVRIRARSIP